VDPQPGALGEDEQFGVEEPAGVLGKRQQRPRLVSPDGLETALGIGEACPHERAKQHVVAARDHLALGAADDP
jgi:hypothetical protein